MHSVAAAALPPRGPLELFLLLLVSFPPYLVTSLGQSEPLLRKLTNVKVEGP